MAEPCCVLDAYTAMRSACWRLRNVTPKRRCYCSVDWYVAVRADAAAAAAADAAAVAAASVAAVSLLPAVAEAVAAVCRLCRRVRAAGFVGRSVAAAAAVGAVTAGANDVQSPWYYLQRIRFRDRSADDVAFLHDAYHSSVCWVFVCVFVWD